MSWEEDKAKGLAFFVLLILAAVLAWAFWPNRG